MTSRRSALSLLLVGTTALTFAQTVSKQSYVNRVGDLVEYNVPVYAVAPTVSSSVLADGRREIKITFSQTFAPGKDKVLVEAFFDSDATTPTLFDQALVATFGTYTYLSSPNLAPNKAAVVKLTDYKQIAAVESAVSGSVVTLRFSPSLVNDVSHNLIRLSWLPSSVSESQLAGGLNGIDPFQIFEATRIKRKYGSLPRIPTRTINSTPSVELIGGPRRRV